MQRTLSKSLTQIELENTYKPLLANQRAQFPEAEKLNSVNESLPTTTASASKNANKAVVGKLDQISKIPRVLALVKQLINFQMLLNALLVMKLHNE
jgi:hypothetical protein